MAVKKTGAPKGATTTSVAAPAAASVATAAEVTEEKVTEVVQSEVLPAETAVEEVAAPSAAEGSTAVPGQLAASDALEALGFGGPHDGKHGAISAADWPRTYRATNNTRMHLCIPVHGLTVERFGAHTDIVISSEDALAGLKAEMDAIAYLNGFGDKDFLLEHVAGE